MQSVQKSHGGKIALIVVACVLAVAVVIGGIVVKRHNDQERWMHDVVYSKEADKVFRDTLVTQYDSKAFSKDGVIQSYKVDDKSIKHSPMGGILGVLIINDNPDLYVYFSLDKNIETGALKGGGGGNSAALGKLLKNEQKGTSGPSVS
ncbi:DUF1310 family protein [Bifidobacterium sp. ESL0769]|uniref:DUF1310 family protein n=1 Tax=Bifidobacterium sp. ESL0769 TaxID=2983229 RepID=UPI0023F7C478|nr:DUF1310 family protein [Bifidobacterium sp. ESL0769]WEV67377.1 DUF1310 family protein [Bifidobacterium sp. ESL0769]